MIDGYPLLYGGGTDGVSPEVIKSDNQAPRVVPYDAAGAALFTSTNPGRVQLGGRPEIGTAASPFPGTDLTKIGGAALDATWFQCRSTTANDLVIPVMGAGYRAATIGVKCTVAYDQDVQFWVFALGSVSSLNTYGLSTILSATLGAGNAYYWMMGAKAGGQGASPGGATISNQVNYAVAAMEHPGYLVFRVKGLSAPPTVGEHKCSIVRA